MVGSILQTKRKKDFNRFEIKYTVNTKYILDATWFDILSSTAMTFRHF